MSLHTAEALILDVFDLHDQDRIVTLLTRERGKVRGVARASRRKHSRFAGQLQPLAKVKAVWFERAGADLVRLSSVELIRTADRLMRELEGILLGSYLAEHMLEFAQENEASDYLFRLLDSTTEALAAGADPDLATRYYEAWVLRLAGIFPPPLDCPNCGRSLERQGVVPPGASEGVICTECAGGTAGGLQLDQEALGFLKLLGRSDLPAMAKIGFDRATLRRLEEVHGRIRRAFLQKELRSRKVMIETLSRVGGDSSSGPLRAEESA